MTKLVDSLVSIIVSHPSISVPFFSDYALLTRSLLRFANTHDLTVASKLLEQETYILSPTKTSPLFSVHEPPAYCAYCRSVNAV